MAASSRYARFANIAYALATEDTATAAALLSAGLNADTTTAIDTVYGVMMADDALADTVVQHYFNFYKIYLRYLKETMNHADSCELTAIASMCPYRDGAVVYKARGLYRMVYLDAGEFSDNCIDTGSTLPCDTCDWMGRHAKQYGKKVLEPAQQYRLFPNPNQGTFTLEAQLADIEPVGLEVVNALGQSIYKEQQQFDNKRLRLQLGNLVPGMYMLHLTDAQGQRFNFKFVVAR